MEEIEMSGVKKTSENKKILALYIVFTLILATQALPQMSIQLISLLFLAALGAVIGFLRRESEKDSLMYNHATYLSRTLWFWGFLLGIGTAAVCIWMTQTYSLDQLLAVSQTLTKGDYNAPEFRHLAMIGIIGLAPSFIYLIGRVIRGFYYAWKNTGLPNPKSLV